VDPLAIAGAFATIVGLLCDYKSEHRAETDDEYRSFLEWLQTKRHDEIMKGIESNIQLANSLKAFLHRDNETIIGKLTAIDDILARIASTIDGFADISRAINPNSELSQQAIGILKQLNNSGGSRFTEINIRGNLLFQVEDGNGRIDYDEPRFIEDDLKTLAKLGLLLLDRTSQGHRMFHLTRTAVQLLKAIGVA